MKNERKKVFVSYCWTSVEHEDFVHNFSVKLVESGINTELDKWDLEYGNYSKEFMEKIVLDETIDHVLMIIDKGYTDKANQNMGGVGIEARIICDVISADSKQTKFIPVVVECDDDGNPYKPVFLSGIFYVDLSDESKYSSGLERLIDFIYGEKAYVKPKIGEVPIRIKRKQRIETIETKKYFENFMKNFNEKFSSELVVHGDLTDVPNVRFKSNYPFITGDFFNKVCEFKKSDEYVDYYNKIVVIDDLNDEEVAELADVKTIKINEQHLTCNPLDNFDFKGVNNLNCYIIDYKTVTTLRDKGIYVPLITSNVLAYCEESDQFVFQLRSKKTKLYPHYYSMPGGGYLPGVSNDKTPDDGLLANADREFWEETKTGFADKDKLYMFSQEIDLITEDGSYPSGSLQFNIISAIVHKDQLLKLKENWESDKIDLVRRTDALDQALEEKSKITPLLRSCLYYWFYHNDLDVFMEKSKKAWFL